MKAKKLVPTTHCEYWVLAALSKATEVGCGSFSVVLDAEQENFVVKLTNSESAYSALLHFSDTSPHFPKVIKHAMNQASMDDEAFHALMMEKIPNCAPPAAKEISDFIHCQPPHKHAPQGLTITAQAIRDRRLTGYPESLAGAIASLGEYARSRRLGVELNQLANWGQRSDGNLVILDLAHSRAEM